MPVMRRSVLLILVLAVQIAGTVVFVWDLLAGLFGLRASPVDWQTREMMEIGAGIALLLGAGFGAVLLIRSQRRSARAEARLRLASGAFADVVEEHFQNWGLTPAERDVALFAIKGMSLQEIATLRSTSEGTVKAQTNAIYRKAGVSGRPQLLSLFIDDLMTEALLELR